MSAGIFLSVKDLQRLLGCKDYGTANKLHIAMRDSLKKKSIRITIKEYCEADDLDFEYVWEFLRGNPKKT